MTLETIAAGINEILTRLDTIETAIGTRDDQWFRMPQPKERCPLTHLSRSTLEAWIRRGLIRTRKEGGARFYNATDALRHIAKDQSPPTAVPA
jgi:hypothetical protein